MATASTYHHQPGIGFDIHDHGLHSSCSHHRLENNQFCVLDRAPDTNQRQNRKPIKTHITTHLNQFLGSPKKTDYRDTDIARSQTGEPELRSETSGHVREKLGEQSRSEVSAGHFAFVSKEFLENNPLAAESQNLPSNAEQLAKHYAGHFEWILSFPAKTSAEACPHPICSHDNPESCGYSGSGECAHPKCSHEHPERCGYQGLKNPNRLLFFGCNLVPRRSKSTPDALSVKDNSDPPGNIYTVVATKLDGAVQSDAIVENTDSTNITTRPEDSQLGISNSQITREAIAEETESMMGDRPGELEKTIVQMDPDSSVAGDTSAYHTDDEMRDDHGQVSMDHRHVPQASFESDSLLIGEYQFEEDTHEAEESDAHSMDDRHAQDEYQILETGSYYRYRHHSSETADTCHQESRTMCRTEQHSRYRSHLSEAMEDEGMESARLYSHMSLASRIEDSVEALDRLEDELEAINDLTRIDRLLSPVDTRIPSMQSVQRTPKAAPPRRTSSKQPRASTVRVKGVERSSTLRKSSSMSFAEDKVAATKSTATRPASLVPPKSQARSNKVPAVASFERPGEVVARRLNEQRAARLSQQNLSEHTVSADDTWTGSPHKVRAKPIKTSTRAASELPGEAISRRRREELEAKQRAQEKDRKTHESTARPVRTSVSKATNPRETVVSRTLQARPGVSRAFEDHEEPRSPIPKAPVTASFASPTASSANKRNATLGRSTAAAKRQSYNAATLPARGRLSMIDSLSAANAGRGTSRASAGSNRSGATGSSTLSKRSTISTEGAQKQKQRGKEVVTRDDGYVAERERERHEGEETAKKARKEAADRSRMQSREWAEKHSLKATTLSGKKKRGSMVGNSQNTRLRFTS
ncbi:hypothetical protein B0T20DRAFT_480919 [Sordaria brevicollis]|uniref:Uncharacterized protein n=1 Tax=Sordaria brevicollis TaxID=83679 RepID=A0AAE0PCE1_SORBR|nr:hypothetical protein B0T20DRAFT_480919 [Sordaria brevicollis]